MDEIPKSLPHGLAIQRGCTTKIPNAALFDRPAGTHTCECGVIYEILVDIPHYTCGPQFSTYIGKILKTDHENNRTHPDYIDLPMDAEWSN